MPRAYFKLNDSQELVAGYDHPFNTWFAQLYDANFSEQTDDDSPAKTAGYHPSEQALSNPRTAHGPYPVPAFDALEAYMRREWGVELTDEQRETIRGLAP